MDPKVFLSFLREKGIEFFAGVPDSLLREFCACLAEQVPMPRHVIAANEGNAVALAIGWYLGARSPALVYLQNSGLGNLFNPHVSLSAREIFGIPMCLLVGWRGEPEIPDEPQHRLQGRITPQCLDLLDIPFVEIHKATLVNSAEIDGILKRMMRESRPVALLAHKDAFSSYKVRISNSGNESFPTREDTIRTIVKGEIERNTLFVATTGHISRELHEIRTQIGCHLGGDLLCVGGMGHANQIAAGLAVAQPSRKVICLDGDGAAIMHLGSLATNGAMKLPNLIHIVLNNGAHDSVGGQPTVAMDIQLIEIARACGYQQVILANTLPELEKALGNVHSYPGPIFLEMRVRRGARANLGRPSLSPVQNKELFLKFLHD